MEDVCEGNDFSFPKQEEKILEMWEAIDAFHTQLKNTEGKPEYLFYDGPPFATGVPHYGHILAGTIKDIVTRYQTATGHHVSRRFACQDCHGLPVEFELDTKLGIKSRDDVLAWALKSIMKNAGVSLFGIARNGRELLPGLGGGSIFKITTRRLIPIHGECV